MLKRTSSSEAGEVAETAAPPPLFRASRPGSCYMKELEEEET